jgi:hypothetical protein
MSVLGAGQSIKATVSAWEGITSHPHRFGGTEYRLGDREIGHVHGDGLVDIPFPTSVRNELVVTGQVVPHHVLPESGWVPHVRIIDHCGDQRCATEDSRETPHGHTCRLTQCRGCATAREKKDLRNH